MKEYKTAVVIGRFQPLHIGHVKLFKRGLEIADRLIIVIGSSNAAPNVKNPFNGDDRAWMAVYSLETEEQRRTDVVLVRDYFYNDASWLAEVQSRVSQYIDPNSTVLVGSYKDGSSYYLKMFPQWDFEQVKDHSGIDSTTIRNILFNQKMLRPDWEGKPSTPVEIPDEIASIVPESTLFKLRNFVTTPKYMDLVLEQRYLGAYRKSWEVAPFPPTFVTADAIVVCSGHVLVVKRKMNPGKGLYAIPGGFIKQNEFIEDAAIRELKEETGIRIDKPVLHASIIDQKVFDNPGRSLRGRTITHGFFIKLRDGDLPEVKGSDDAEKAFWMPIMDIGRNEDKFFEDHAHIIHYFINRV